MGKRKYFIISLLFAICALCSDSVSKRDFSRSSYVLAKSFSASEADKARAKIESDEFLRKGHIFQYFGIIFAILGFFMWLVSEVRREPVWRSIPLVLLIFWFLLQFVMV